MIGALAALAAVAGVLAVVWLRRRYLVVTVRGESMLPTYRPGERLVLRRTPPRSLRTGQVVVLTEAGASRPGTPLSGPRAPADGGTLLSGQRAPADGTGTGPHLIIKRVAAVPGDPIPRDTVPALRTAPGTHVPAGHLVVLGDNADRSHDSRHSGYLTTDRLLGVVLRKVG
ncbi:S26 family signal peptidase [Nonomuraea zeae]|uniref:signal peptidase I n=1 Tax=Nonomuraea zeae TaxID=1642303 RepID=A0A5S4GGX8_9ACTN|nr:S26 family signal peptidase [Nonomuraea zeae]TMR32216.1 S26 family signal peptidase [Nonomuraea zeae]